MGQQISLSDYKIPDLYVTNNQQSTADSTTNVTEDIHLFLPFDIIHKINNNNSTLLSNQKISDGSAITRQTLINQLRNDIDNFSNLSGIKEFNTKMSEIIKEILNYIDKMNINLQNSTQLITNKQKQLQESYVQKLKDDENETTSIFSETLIDSEKSSDEQHLKELSFFAVQSLITMLLMLLESVHRSDSTLVHRMLNLTNQLVEEIPLNFSSSDVYKRSNHLLKSLKPLTNYITDLSIQTDIDPTAANQSIKILLNFAVMKTSFKDILPLIRKLLFNTEDIFDIKKLFIKLNKHLTFMLDRFEKEKQTSNNVETGNPDTIGKNNDIEQKFLAAVEYLKLIEAYPTTHMLTLNEKKFTGQFICSILLVHIDLHNQVHGKSKLEQGSINGSFSFEFERQTFTYLYEIIEQLLVVETSSSTYILNVCLRLFTTHLQFLISANLENFHEFLNENEVEKWFILISKLAFENQSEESQREASKALTYLIEKRFSTLSQMLSFIHQTIIDNQYPILIDQLLNKLNQQVFIYKWIEILCNNQHENDRTLAYTVLHSLIDLVLKSTSVDNEQVNRLREILIMFQELLLVYLNQQSVDIPDELRLSTLSTLAIEYTTHVLKICFEQNILNTLFESLLLGLSILTELKFNFTIIQPIFTALMPLFAEYILETNPDIENKTYYLISWLLGKMSQRLITGPSQNTLEKKYDKTLKSPLFSGGYETLTTDPHPYLTNLFKSNLTLYSRSNIPFRRQQSILDNDFLISIYQNRDQGALLISKMKALTRGKQQAVQPSIENLANEACAAVFAVYIKHYRRIELARYELMQPMEQKPHPKLFVLYEYANEVRKIFADTKARGDDCNELCQKIKNNALLLLVSIRESCFIAKTKEDFFSPNTMKRKIQFQQQQQQKSHWTKAKSVIRLLRLTLNACVRLKNLILEKKRAIENKQDSESLMHRAISNFLYENEKFQMDSNEIVQCLIRQYQRAITRLITYRFIEQFIRSSKEKNRSSNILFLNLKDTTNSEWHYLDNIQASNNQLKEDIGRIYYNIIKNILSFSMKSHMNIVHILNLINLDYDSMDLCLLNEFQFIHQLFDRFIRSTDDTTNDGLINIKFTTFNWFRLVIIKLCENIQLEKVRNLNLGNRKFHQILEQQCNFIFNQLIINELKRLEQNQLPYEDLSLQNLSLIRLSKTNTNISINQYLFVLLRCIHLYDHIRLYYATIDYIKQLLNLYQTNQFCITRLLTLKILRDLLIYVQDEMNRTLIENFLTKIVLSIGQNFYVLDQENKIDLAIVIELIYIYRQILSYDSPWQKFATELIIDGIKLGTSLETIESEQMNMFVGCLCILGGYVRPFCLGSSVEIYSMDEDVDELQYGIIIEINQDALESDAKPYLIQYAETNQTEWISSNLLRVTVDVQTPNLLLLPIENAAHIILDTLGFLSEKIDGLTIDSFIVLDIKCRLVKVFYEILNFKQMIDIFMNKSYASILAKLSISMDHFESIRNEIPNDLRLFNRLHFEQYYLSLDRYVRKNQLVVENKFASSIQKENEWNHVKIKRDPIILQYLTETSSIDDVWKPMALKNEIKSYQKGRLGKSDIQIICLPVNDNIAVFEECGNKHKFQGRINISHKCENTRHRTFTPDGIELNEGKWFFCIRLPEGGTARIGWATKRFSPPLYDGYGLGDDEYSWGFDEDTAYYDKTSSGILSFSNSWSKDDVCGCGIEIDGINTNITYWLNGKLKGTIYSHSDNKRIKSAIKTNLLPNGVFPTYFPAVSVRLNRYGTKKGVFEFIFSPEDMTKCPLPNGYKPLLMPKLLTIENSLVPYPYSAYLIGHDIQQYFYTKRWPKNDSHDQITFLLRDFVNNQHLQVPFNSNMITTDNHLLKLSKEIDGFPLSLDHHQELTISFNFEINSTTETRPDELDIVLFKLEDELFPIHIYMNDNSMDETNTYRQHVAILFQSNEQTKVYINNKLLTLNHHYRFDENINSKMNLRLLPSVNAGLRNLGIWPYLLSEEYIQRLFTYGLSYVAIDNEKLKQYQQRINTIEFKAEQRCFTNEILVPLNEPFKEDLWEKTKRSIVYNESSYFKTIPDTNQSVVQLFGNKTYLVLDTANQIWLEYTLILDISIPNFPSAMGLSDDEARLTLVSLANDTEIYITHDGHLRITAEDQSSSTIKLHEYIRLFISVQQTSIHIYVNGSLELDVSINLDQFAAKFKRIDLFREFDLTKNTTHDDQVRIECRSITYLNKSTHPNLSSSMKKFIQSTEYSLEELVVPSFDILSTSLIGIGYKEQSIKYVMNKYNTTNLYVINKILREENQTIDSIYQQEQQQKRHDVLRRLSLYDDDEKKTLNMFIDTNDVTNEISVSIIDNDENDDIPSDKKWFYDTIRSVGICDTLDHWLQDQEINNQLIAKSTGSELLDLTKADSNETKLLNKFKQTMATPSHYAHQQMSFQTYGHSRTTCEYGLITIYARHTILHMLKVWSNEDHVNLFPLLKFGDGNFLVKFLRFMYHNGTINRLDLWIISIIKMELNNLLKCVIDEKLTVEIFNREAPVLFHLQKQFVEESIYFLTEPSSIDIDKNNTTTIDEQIFIKPYNLEFLLKIIHLFSKILTDFQGTIHDIDLIIRLLFPNIMIKILFDLFLYVPLHQSKIFLVNLFVKLIQTGEHFKLHNDIQTFLHHLSIEVIIKDPYCASLALKFVRRSLMYFELILMEREKQFRSSMNEWSDLLKELALGFDLINILTNQIKSCQWPELFLSESKEILGEKLILTNEMVETAHSHFDRTTDEQVMKFMNENITFNNSSSSNDFIINFIENLPADSVPDLTKYAPYPRLCGIPSVHIQTWIKLLYVFNIFLGRTFLNLDFNVTSGLGFILDRIQSVRSYILFGIKMGVFDDVLAQTAIKSDSTKINVNFDILKASVAEHPEDTMFYQAYKQLKSDASQIFRRTVDEPVWKAIYVGMFSEDQGGPYRDSVTRICADICSTRLPLFILCPNGRTNTDLNRDRWIPNVFPPKRSISVDIKNQYRFVGQLMGMAIRTKQYLDVRFPILFWKQLIYEEVTIQDIEAIDSSSFTIINQMKKNIEKIKSFQEDADDDDDDDMNGNSGYVFDSVMTDITFDVVSSTGQTYELIPGGFQTRITAENFEDYCMRYRQYRINEFYRQIEYIRQGLYSVVPGVYLNLFTAHEFEEAVCGKRYIDIDMLKRHTGYYDDNESSPHIQLFWSVLRDMFSEEQKKLFLIFVWGRSTLPYTDDEFSTNFTIARLEINGNVDQTLPRSYTCAFTLQLPAYSTKEIMYERLNYALSYCSGIDADRNMN